MKKSLLASAVVVAAFMSSCSSNSDSSIKMGSKSDFDSLSYALGVNIASSMQQSISDIPFDVESMQDGIEQAAFGKGKMTQEEAMPILQEYFMSKRGARLAEVEKLRDAADSVALANGADSVEIAAARANMPADDSMFASADERDSVSYAFGIDLGSNIKNSDLPIHIYWLNSAVNDVFTGAEELTIDPMAAQSYLQNYFTVVVPQQNAEASEAWLAKMAKKSGAKTTESGIVYKIEEMGDETLMAKDDRDQVKVIYTGKDRKGKVFDSSRFDDKSDEEKAMIQQHDSANYGKDREIEFALNGVIKGWTEGMKLVGKGGRISLWIPADLAYGVRGAGSAIGPNEALYFDVEVIDVIPFVEEPAAEDAE